MATWDDVRELALAMPGAHEDPRGGAWKADGSKAARSFAWDRPLRARDIQEHGPEDGPIIGVRVADEGEKAALIASDPDVFFTIPHFDGYNAVLVRLDRISKDRLLEVMADSWLVVAPKRVAAAYLASSNEVSRTGRDPASSSSLARQLKSRHDRDCAALAGPGDLRGGRGDPG